MLKVVYGTGCAGARVLTIFHAMFWPMSTGEDSKPELGLKNIGILMETRVDASRRHRLVARERIIHGADYCQNIGI